MVILQPEREAPPKGGSGSGIGRGEPLPLSRTSPQAGPETFSL